MPIQYGKRPRNSKNLNINLQYHASNSKIMMETKQIIQGKNIDTVGYPLVTLVLLEPSVNFCGIYSAPEELSGNDQRAIS